HGNICGGEPVMGKAIKSVWKYRGQSNFEHALRFLESKNLIDVVVVFSLRAGEVLSYPVLKEKTQRMIKLYGVEEILLERKPVKW
ncbi:hypothetical protein RZO85_28420, partial [Raoultella ornithinolytica]|uniref:hypothetical protein n=1 Tax=Raoultella ornithinolytica TaxID=54291 RepID=UPI00292C4828